MINQQAKKKEKKLISITVALFYYYYFYLLKGHGEHAENINLYAPNDFLLKGKQHFGQIFAVVSVPLSVTLCIIERGGLERV